MAPALGCGISIARLMAPLHVANDPLAATAARSASTERTAACNTAAAWVGTRRAAASAAVADGADGSCSGARVPAVCQRLASVVVAHGESGEAVEHGDAAGGTRKPHTAP